MAKLVLVRHGISEYNQKGIWTGWDNPPMVEQGFEEARKAGESIKDIYFDQAYCATFIRAGQTLSEILKVLEQTDMPVVEAKEVNERNYGVFTGKNKWQVKQEVGEEEFKKIRRGWDHQIPKGESLKQVYERFIPYYESEILPKLKEGKNVIISSSGNALRTLVKYLEHISDDKIADVEFGIGEVWVYDIDKNGKVLNKEIRNKNPLVGKI